MLFNYISVFLYKIYNSKDSYWSTTNHYSLLTIFSCTISSKLQSLWLVLMIKLIYYVEFVSDDGIMRSGDLCAVLVTGAEGWTFSYTCALCIWICYYIAHCYCEGDYISFDEAAGKWLFCHCNIKKKSGMLLCMLTIRNYCYFFNPVTGSCDYVMLYINSS